jgi:DNA-binding NtrC family response regulator
LENDIDFSFEIKTAESVEEAIDVLKDEERRFDVVIIDWRLAESKTELEVLDGLKALRPHFPKIKIVYTAYPSIENCVKAIKAGADDYIDKTEPGSLDRLIDSIKRELFARKHEDNEPDREWVDEHFDELRERYYGELIAFIDGKVVDHGKNRKELEKRVMEKYGEKPYIMFAPVEVF